MTREISPQSKYNWMLDMELQLPAGKAHVADKGVQFSCTPKSFTKVVHAMAHQRGLEAETVIFKASVVYVFYKPTDLLKPNLDAYEVVKNKRAAGA